MKMQGWTWKYVIEILKNGDTVVIKFACNFLRLKIKNK